MGDRGEGGQPQPRNHGVIGHRGSWGGHHWGERIMVEHAEAAREATSGASGDEDPAPLPSDPPPMGGTQLARAISSPLHSSRP